MAAASPARDHLSTMAPGSAPMGDPKAQGKLTGFFMGKVMQASKGQADGKTATALLRSKAGL